MGRFLARLIVVPLGFIFAGVMALGVLLTIGMERLVRHMHVEAVREGSELESVMGLLDQVLFMGGVAATLTVLPGLLVVIAGEAARIRSLLFYVVGGGIAFAVMPLLGQWASATTTGLPSSTLLAIFATAGFVAGLCYWLIAGRWA